MTTASLRGSRPKYPRPFRSSVVYGPSDPAVTWFLAIIQYAPIDQDGHAQPIERTEPGMIFTNNQGTWAVSAADVQAPIPHPTFGGDSILGGTDSDSHYILSASRLADDYASYLKMLSAGQQPDVPFVTGLNSFAWQLARIQWPPSSIAVARFSFVVDTAQLVSYSVVGSGAKKSPEVVLFVVRRAVALAPRQGCLVRRQDDIEWSDVVPAGSYRSLTLNSVSVIAATVPLNDGDTSQGRKVIDTSGGIDDVSVVGVRC